MRYLILFLILAHTNAAKADKYDEALNKAKDAAYIQTGLSGYEQQLRKYGEKEAMYYVRKLKIDKEFATGLLCYKVMRDKEIKFRVSRNKQLEVKPSSVNLIIELN